MARAGHGWKLELNVRETVSPSSAETFKRAGSHTFMPVDESETQAAVPKLSESEKERLSRLPVG